MRRAGRLTIPALILLAACGRVESRTETKAPRATPPPVPADVQDVARAIAPAGKPAGAAPAAAAALDHLDLSGEFVSPMQSDVAAKIVGRVGTVHVHEGERVRRGQPLLSLETDYLRLEVARAAAEAARARAAATEARSEFERKTGLLQKGSVSQAVFDRAQGAHDQTRAAAQAAAAAEALARQKLTDATVLSPVDGVVVSRRADVGEHIGDNTVTFVVAQTAPLRLRFRVPERYLNEVTKGRSVRASTDPFPGEVFSGKITLVGQSVDPGTRSFLVEAEFPNRDGRLRPGLFARVELDLAG